MRHIARHPFPDTPTGRIIDECLAAGGKYLRADLMHICAAIGSESVYDKEKLYMLSAMAELLHLASLIHDDIIDDAVYRRGRRSIQSRFGKDEAVYAGDYIMARVNYYVAVEYLNDASAILSETVASMCCGEIAQAQYRFRTDTTTDMYQEVIKGKTADLFSAVCRIGAMNSGCSDDVIESVSDFGAALGMLFQLRDDLVDITEGSSKEGKDTGKDFICGVYTYPVLAALSRDDGDLMELMVKNGREGIEENDLRRVLDLVKVRGGIESTKQELQSYKKRAEDILNTLPEKKEIKILRMILDKLMVL